MILTHLGLSGDDQRTLLNVVAGGTYKARARVQLLNLDGDHLGDISDYLSDGQVDGDWSQPVQRTATLTFTDPKRHLPFDADSPADVALDLNRMLRVVWEIWVDAWQDWQPVPIFTGPVTGMQRNGDQAVIDCSDKALFGMSDCWKPLHLGKGMKKSDAIRRIMTERAGAASHELDVDDLAARIPHARSLHPQAKPWLHARKIAHSMDRQLLYDGAGILRLRHHPTQPRFSFTGEAHITSPIQIAYSDEQLINAVEVKGAQPKGPKSQVIARAVAPADHRFSPARMGRNDTPRFLAKFVQDGSIKHVKEAQARADRELADGLIQGVDVTLSCVPVPFLDLGDMCHVDTEDGNVTFRLKTFSFPLLVGEGTDGSPAGQGTDMTVGVHRNFIRSHHRPRHRGHKHQRRERHRREHARHGRD